MNDKVKGIIVCGVVLACLGGTLGILKLMGIDTSDSDSEAESSSAASLDSDVESVQLIDVSASDIAKVEVSNEYGGFTYVGESDSGLEAAHIEELVGLSQSSSAVADIAEDLSQLTAYKLVEENADNLGKYGLETPSAEFTITFADDSEMSFVIGDVSPQSRYRYFAEADSDTVYMMLESTVTSFLNRKEDLLDMTLLSSDDEDSIDFGTLTVSRKEYDYDIVIKQDDGSYEKSSEYMPSAQLMTEPIFSYLNGTTSSDVIYSLFGLTAVEASVIFPTDEDLAEYGLDDPIAVVTFVGEEVESGDEDVIDLEGGEEAQETVEYEYNYTLVIGNSYHEENENGEELSEASGYYCLFTGVDGKDCIWLINASSLPWIDLVPEDLISTLMTWNNITDVAEVNVTGDSEASFEITSEEDDDGNQEVTSVSMNGEEADVDLFKDLYQYILSIPTTEVYFDDPVEEEPYLTIDIVRNDDISGDTIELYKDSERYSIIKLNGQTSYRIQTNWATVFQNNLEAVANGEAIEDEY